MLPTFTFSTIVNDEEDQHDVGALEDNGKLVVTFATSSILLSPLRIVNGNTMRSNIRSVKLVALWVHVPDEITLTSIRIQHAPL